MRVRLAIAALLAACSGAGTPVPDGTGGAGPGPGPAPTGGRGGAAPGPGVMVPAPDAPGPCVSREPFRSPLRRLTRIEYDNTVRDLLGDTTAPASRFPPDEVSGGFANNAAVLTVSPLLAEKYQEAAEALAATAVKDVITLTGCDPQRTGEEPCARQFVERFGRRAYRRPLGPAEASRLLQVYVAARTGATFARGIEVTLRALLQSPHFLYRLESASQPRAGAGLVKLSPWETATRLSYLLWATMPDDRLLAAAERNELATPDQVARMARAMLDDPRARRPMAQFYQQWLRLGALETLEKDARAYPAFTAAVRDGMRAEAPAFVEHVVWGDGRLNTLLTAPIGFVTPALAPIYGVSAPAGAGPHRVALPAAERAGLLTQAGVLATHALAAQSSPVHRGKLVREQVLCQEMPPQPPDLMVVPPEVDPRRPTRERFAQHARDPACAGCHRLMDPIGFAFEAHDGIGRFRTQDGGRPVDTTGELVETRDLDGAVNGARALAERLAGSGQVRDCVATQWYRFAFGRLEGPGDHCSVRALRAAFAGAGGDLRELLVALVRTEAFLHRPEVTR